jgi:hypothetical protein
MNAIELQHYKSSDGNFGLDIPKSWISSPADHLNSPNEVIRFGSHENGRHLLIIFRATRDPQSSPQSHSEQVQQLLAKSGFSNFVSTATTIGTAQVLTPDFARPAVRGAWSCRHYFFFDGTVVYTLGFGTSKRDAMFDVFDEIAKSFVIGKPFG